MLDITIDTIAVAPEDVEIAPVETAEETALTTNVYTEIKRRLTARGVQPEAVAFIHDARTQEQKARLYAAVNEGSIRILIGSTEKMGTGMNVQERLLALHHLDAPWKPSDIEQRNGRMLRQGNRYPQVFQFVHIAEGSFDGFVWQGLETKATFISQIAGGEIDDDVCEVEDVSDTVMSFSEIKAAASGNPIVIEKIGLDQEFTRLRAIRKVWAEDRKSAEFAVGLRKSRRDALAKTVKLVEGVIAIRDQNTGEKFFIILDGQVYTSRELAGAEIRRLAGKSKLVTAAEIGSYRGFNLYASLSDIVTPMVFVRVCNKDMEFNIGDSDLGILASLDAKLRFERELEDAWYDMEQNEIAIASFEAELAVPWKHEARFEEVYNRLNQLESLLDFSKKDLSAETSEVSAVETHDGMAEARAALEAIRILHANPEVLARFGQRILADDHIPVLIPAIEVTMPREQEPVLLEIPSGVAAQLDLFGGFVTVKDKRRR